MLYNPKKVERGRF